MSHEHTKYDFIVVGAGIAGSVVAAWLSEDTNLRVLPLEAGGATPLPASAHPPSWPTLLQGEANWGDQTAVQSAIGRAAPFARGRGIGGSSTINAMVFARGHTESYATWTDDGVIGWSFDDLLPYFKRSETALHGDPALRGIGGPMVVAPANPPNPVLVACLCAALQRGYPRAADVSGGLDVGFGFADLNIVDGKRQSAADAYLQPASQRQNLDIVAGALVHRLRIENVRCTGAEYSTDTTQSAEGVTAGEVILAAGAIGSPQLLMVSGVGPQKHLQEAGVSVIHDLPGVGSNLHDHPITPLVYRAARPVPPAQHNHGELLGLIRAETFGGAPDIQIFGVDSADVPGLGGSDGFVLGVSVLQPFSRGSVRLSSATVRTAPIIDPDYLGDDRDMRSWSRGCGSPARSAPPRRWTRGERRRLRRAPAFATTPGCGNTSDNPLPRTSTPWVPVRWAARRDPSSIVSCAPTASAAFALSISRSCPRSPQTTPQLPSTRSPSVQPI